MMIKTSRHRVGIRLGLLLASAISLAVLGGCGSTCATPDQIRISVQAPEAVYLETTTFPLAVELRNVGPAALCLGRGKTEYDIEAYFRQTGGGPLEIRFDPAPLQSKKIGRTESVGLVLEVVVPPSLGEEVPGELDFHLGVAFTQDGKRVVIASRPSVELKKKEGESAPPLTRTRRFPSRRNPR